MTVVLGFDCVLCACVIVVKVLAGVGTCGDCLVFCVDLLSYGPGVCVWWLRLVAYLVLISC